MDLKIIQKQDNPLLSRTEIKAEANFFNASTPKKEDIKKKISTMEKADEKLVVIKNIYNDFGTGKADVSAYVYKSEEELKKTEPKKKEKKAKAGEETTEETPKEEAKEAPKEEVKETKEKPKEEAKETPKEEAKETTKEEQKNE